MAFSRRKAIAIGVGAGLAWARTSALVGAQDRGDVRAAHPTWSQPNSPQTRVIWSLDKGTDDRFAFSVQESTAGEVSRPELVGHFQFDGQSIQAIRSLFDRFYAVSYAAQAEWATLTDQLGRELWDLVPSTIRDHYWQRLHESGAESLVVRSKDLDFPWELVTPVEARTGQTAPMLGLSYAIARWDGMSTSRLLKAPEIRVIAPHLEDLPLAQQEEVADLAQHFGGVHVLPGDTAQLLALLESGTPSVIHVTTHGNFDRMLMADGLLILDDVLAMPTEIATNVHLAFLNVCEAGQPNWSASDLNGGWPDALMAAGSVAVVGPLWRVVGQVTREAALQFYSSLGAGRSVAHAVLDIRRRGFSSDMSDRLRGHPSWLAYVAVGHPDVVVSTW